jgi:mRNA interferase HigB
LRAWRQTVNDAHWANFAELRAIYPQADQVGRCIVFNLGGNKYRLVAAIHYNRGVAYVRHVLTHAQVLHGKRKLRREHISRLADFFGVSPAAFGFECEVKRKGKAEGGR